MKRKFNVTGMHCASCQAAVERSVKKMNGVNSVEVNLLGATMTVDFDEAVISAADICNTVEDSGFGAEEADEPRRRGSEAKEIGKRFLLSLIFLVPLMFLTTFHMLGMPLPEFLLGKLHGWLQLILTFPILVINRSFFINGMKAVFRRSPNMDTLICTGASAAFLFSLYVLIFGGAHLYFESAAMILTLITLGKYLEARSKRRTGDALEDLENLAPKTALVLRDGYEIEIPASRLKIGDTVILKPGMTAPADGTVIDGSSYLDQSAVTGESEYVFKQSGDSIISASINHGGYLRFEATKVGADTSFSRIVALVSEASASKAPIQRLADKIAGVFVPIVILIALITFAVWMIVDGSFETSLIHAVSVLVISCPCALGLAAPVAVMTGTGRGAQLSILYSSAEILERACKITTVALDKTGTITKGKPSVTDILSFNESDPLPIAAALENLSEHPLALAIAEKAAGLQLPDVTDFVSTTGKGISGVINGSYYHVGNAALMAKNAIDVSICEKAVSDYSSQGKTVIYVADSRELLGIIAIADTVRDTSKTAVTELSKENINVIMLTGDNKRTASVVAGSVGIDSVRADLLPEDKEKIISELQQNGEIAAMVGDGINDAPALARADIGISMGAGTDIALHSSDIVLLRDDLSDLPTAIRLSKAVLRNIKQNFFWALFYNALCIPLAAGVFIPFFGISLSPAYAAAAMSVSSLFVVGNSLRLRFFKPNKK